MSFILDALKKSEAERQRQAGPALLEMRVVAPQRRLPLWAIAVAVLLLVNLLVLGWFALHRAPSATASVPAAAPTAAAGTATPNPTATLNTSQPVSPATAPVAAAAPVASDTADAPAPAAAAETDNPADLAPAENPTPGTVRVERSAGLQNYQELSGKLPDLRLDLHVYAAKPAERYAFINMHKVREGDVTPEGVRVMEITNDGVVLDYRGTEFLLGHE